MIKNTVLDKINEHDAKFVDLRFTDIRGKEQHITLPASAVNNDFIENGKMIDGSSFLGWQGIQVSDLIVIPDLNTIKVDPFFQDSTLFIRCNVVDPTTMMGYGRCPRVLAQRAEAYLRSTGIADTANFGPEPEFFIFDNVQWKTDISGSFYKIDSEEAQWNSAKEIEGGNIGHRPSIKGGYFPVPPVDSSHDIRSAICLILESLGIVVEAHHHEVATANQNEVQMLFHSLVYKADDIQTAKYVIHNVAHNYGKTATFMPKPLVGDNGNGMHCHQSLFKEGINLFAGDHYAGLSELALYYIGGIIKHARTLNAFTNPSTNSYKRLVPGFEAPILLAYSARNRSAAIRIPHVSSPKARRIEVRFPDPTANPYLAFSAMMMAGIDGIQKKIHPGDAIDKDLYDLPPEELIDVPSVCSSLEQSMECLRANHEFLLQGDVFTTDFINNYIRLKEEEITKIRSLTHPYEFELYYSL
jgi:glutamine synthetase